MLSMNHILQHSNHCVVSYPWVWADTVTQFQPVEYDQNDATWLLRQVTGSLAISIWGSWHFYSWDSSSWNSVMMMWQSHIGWEGHGKVFMLMVPFELILNSKFWSPSLMNFPKPCSATLSLSASFRIRKYSEGENSLKF